MKEKIGKMSKIMKKGEKNTNFDKQNKVSRKKCKKIKKNLWHWLKIEKNTSKMKTITKNIDNMQEIKKKSDKLE